MFSEVRPDDLERDLGEIDKHCEGSKFHYLNENGYLPNWTTVRTFLRVDGPECTLICPLMLDYDPAAIFRYPRLVCAMTERIDSNDAPTECSSVIVVSDNGDECREVDCLEVYAAYQNARRSPDCESWRYSWRECSGDAPVCDSFAFCGGASCPTPSRDDD